MDHEHLQPETSQEDDLLIAFRTLDAPMKIHLLRMAQASAKNTHTKQASTEEASVPDTQLKEKKKR